MSSSKVLTYKIYKSIYTSYNFVVQKAFILRPPLSIREVNDQSGEHLQCDTDVANTSTKVQVSYLWSYNGDQLLVAEALSHSIVLQFLKKDKAGRLQVSPGGLHTGQWMHFRLHLGICPFPQDIQLHGSAARVVTCLFYILAHTNFAILHSICVTVLPSGTCMFFYILQVLSPTCSQSDSCAWIHFADILMHVENSNTPQHIGGEEGGLKYAETGNTNGENLHGSNHSSDLSESELSRRLVLVPVRMLMGIGVIPFNSLFACCRLGCVISWPVPVAVWVPSLGAVAELWGTDGCGVCGGMVVALQLESSLWIWFIWFFSFKGGG